MKEERKIFSKKGLEKHKQILSEQQEKLNKATIRMGVAMNLDGWHENSDFEGALQEAGVEGQRWYDMREILENALVYEPEEQNKNIKIGNTVMYTNVVTKEFKEITIGAFGEVNLEMGIISYESPLAIMLLGKKVGSKFELAPSTFCIKEIHPPSYKYWNILDIL